MYVSGESNLLLSIIVNAYEDATKKGVCKREKDIAINFLKNENGLLEYYCDLMDINHEIVTKGFEQGKDLGTGLRKLIKSDNMREQMS